MSGLENLFFAHPSSIKSTPGPAQQRSPAQSIAANQEHNALMVRRRQLASKRLRLQQQSSMPAPPTQLQSSQAQRSIAGNSSSHRSSRHSPYADSLNRQRASGSNRQSTQDMLSLSPLVIQSPQSPRDGTQTTGNPAGGLPLGDAAFFADLMRVINVTRTAEQRVTEQMRWPGTHRDTAVAGTCWVSYVPFGEGVVTMTRNIIRRTPPNGVFIAVFQRQNGGTVVILEYSKAVPYVVVCQLMESRSILLVKPHSAKDIESILLKESSLTPRARRDYYAAASRDRTNACLVFNAASAVLDGHTTVAEMVEDNHLATQMHLKKVQDSIKLRQTKRLKDANKIIFFGHVWSKPRPVQSTLLTAVRALKYGGLLIVSDSAGGIGKSVLATYLGYVEGATICMTLSRKDGAESLASAPSSTTELLVFDLPRATSGGKDKFSFLENLQDGRFPKDKYKSSVQAISLATRIVVFTNMLINELTFTKVVGLSRYKVKLITIKDNVLVCQDSQPLDTHVSHNLAQHMSG